MSESVKAILPVVVTDAGISNASEGHRLYKQMNIHLIDRSAAKGEAGEEMIDSFLVVAEEESGERFGALLHFENGRVNLLVGEDRKKRSEDLIVHNWIVPRDGIEDCGIDVARCGVRRTAGDDLLL